MTKYYWEVFYIEELDLQLLTLTQRDMWNHIVTIADYTPDSFLYWDVFMYQKHLVHSWEA